VIGKELGLSARVGILHPGQMGASVAAAARSAGNTVRWASAGRGPSTAGRAREAGLEDVATLAALCAACDVVISVCPPAAAVDVARAVADAKFGGVFVDANAVAPATALEVRDVVEAGGARFVDGGIIGPPAREPGTTRLYLSGVGAEAVADLFEESALEAVAIEGGPGAASALKMSYAAWTKGCTALIMAVRALAAANGVDEALLIEWRRSQPGVEERSQRAVANNAFKAWRFAGEMREIASTFEAAGLPGGFHAAAADVYERLAGFKDRDAPTVADVVQTLLGDERA